MPRWPVPAGLAAILSAVLGLARLRAKGATTHRLDPQMLDHEAVSSAVARETEQPHFKDEILDQLADVANVAQFVSFAPDLTVRFVRVHKALTEPPGDVDAAVRALLDDVPSVNVRSFKPEQPKSHDFIYGLTDETEVVAEVRRLATQGLYTIINETIDIHDGGVSGVAYGGVIEFAPDDTPRCVEKPGTASLPLNEGLHMLETVYGFKPALDYAAGTRVEFSLHPLRGGIRREHTIVWELERGDEIALTAEVAWPNRFSRFLGDKTFGLLVADAIGLRVPRTLVVSRRVPPFEFGAPTGTADKWTRTAPVEQVPGRFTTQLGWTDPFELLRNEDPGGSSLAAVLAQEGVDASWSGAAVTTPERAMTEGVRGTGESFMQGLVGPEELPPQVVEEVESVIEAATTRLGPVRMEWVHDGQFVWVVQLHSGGAPTAGQVVYPGRATVEHRFPVDQGLEALRALVEEVRGSGEGIVLVGSVGVTSHFGDVLRRAKVPARIESEARG